MMYQHRIIDNTAQFHMYNAIDRHQVRSEETRWASEMTPSTMDAAISTMSRDQYNTFFNNNERIALVESSQYSSNHQQSPKSLLRRRSHRPRGCRGGRKNRKQKTNSNEAPNASHLDCHTQEIRQMDDPTMSPYQNANSRSLENRHSPRSLFSSSHHAVTTLKGDLSPYQHLKIKEKTWNFGAQGFTINAAPLSTTRGSATKYSQHQMLPPPVPSALFESHHQNVESLHNTSVGIGLKMLPSFDVEDDNGCGDEYNDDGDDYSNESIEIGMAIPHPPSWSRNEKKNDLRKTSATRQFSGSHAPCNNIDCEATADTYTTSSRSRSESDDSETSVASLTKRNIHMIHKQQHPSKEQSQRLSASQKSLTVLPIVHLHVAQQGQQTQPQSAAHCSLFVTSPRSFLMGMVSANSSINLHSKHFHKYNDLGQINNTANVGDSSTKKEYKQMRGYNETRQNPNRFFY